MKEPISTVAPHPIPTISPDVEAAWLEWVAKGALIGLIISPLLVCYGLLIVLQIVPICFLVEFLSVVFAVCGVVIVWLITSPEPKNPYWLLRLRWAARIGVLMSFAGTVAPLVGRGILALSVGTAEWFAVVYEVSLLGGLAGASASAWYDSRLSRWLGDRALRINFGVIKWIFAVLFVLATTGVMLDWEEAIRRSVSVIESGPNWRTASGTWSSTLRWIVFYVGIGIWSVWLAWRFWQRLERAANKIWRRDMTATVED